MTDKMELDEIKKKLQQMLSPKRYAHSVHVMESSRALAEKYGEDADKAALAGLIHDCAKGLTEQEAFDLCGKYGIMVDSIMCRQPELLHGMVGAFLVRDLFGVDCQEILDAVADHTMGREGMSKLSCIVFIADYIEEGRSFPGVDEIRKAASESLEKAMVVSIDSTISHILKNGGLLHPQTVITRNWALEKLLQREKAG